MVLDLRGSEYQRRDRPGKVKKKQNFLSVRPFVTLLKYLEISAERQLHYVLLENSLNKP